MDGRGRPEYDGKGLHIHDEGLNIHYEIFEEDGRILVGPLKFHEAGFSLAKAEEHFAKWLEKPGNLQKLRQVNASAWGTYCGARESIRNVGKLLRNGANFARRASVFAGAILMIAAASEISARAAESIQSWGANRARGDTAYADLDAINFAIQVQDLTGNYFYGYAALDILLAAE